MLKRLYPQLTWKSNDHNRCIYLTFDDGPIPIVTPFVLNILQQYNAKATFFCIGDNVHKHPNIFEQVKNAGHAIGNHTYNHLKGWVTKDKTYLDNFLKADELLDAKLFRPPYGRIKRSQVKLLKEAKPGLKFVMWSVLSGDFDLNLEPQRCLDNVISNTVGGDIVLFHDSLKAVKRLEYALPKAMEYWSEQGYAFKSFV
ncbi:MAG TPA: polysaccharide deacetylase family protein [Mucilaginibacter sp.]